MKLAMMLGASATLVQAVPKQDGAKHCVGECQSGLGANPPHLFAKSLFGAANRRETRGNGGRGGGGGAPGHALFRSGGRA